MTISRTDAAMNVGPPMSARPAGYRPALSPALASTNENSPICAITNPLAAATESGYPIASAAPAVMTTLRIRTIATATRIERQVSQSRTGTSSSIPTETKNIALKRICSGMISPKACWLKRLSLTTNPARNAPSERLTPARLVNHAVPKQIATTASRNSSGEQVRATRSSSGGMTRRATASTMAMMPSALASAMTMSAAEPTAASQHRDEQDHHDDGEVLKDQQAERDLPQVVSLSPRPRGA